VVNTYGKAAKKERIKKAETGKGVTFGKRNPMKTLEIE